MKNGKHGFTKQGVLDLNRIRTKVKEKDSSEDKTDYKAILCAMDGGHEWKNGGYGDDQCEKCGVTETFDKDEEQRDFDKKLQQQQ